MQVENLMRPTATAQTQDLADDELVDLFLTGDGIDSDHAFRILVERHGPMVLGVCRQILDHEADAEDAFQLTFLVLARKVASVRNRAILGAWLHEVAYRTAVKTRVKIIRRRSLERQSVSMSPSEFVPDRQHQDAAWSELRPVLHDEVRRLPDKYRIPIILSYLEGRTNEEVAALLQWPVGTVKGRLSRARALLQSRLVRRGVTLSAAFLLSKLADGAVFAEVVSPELVTRTMRMVREFKNSSALSQSVQSPDQPALNSPFPKQAGATLNSLRGLPTFTHISLPFLISLLSIFTMIGITVAFGAGGGLAYFRPLVPASLRASATATPGNLPDRATAASCH
jgi:RNA polymerase sigma factor (sigma-70 family)